MQIFYWPGKNDNGEHLLLRFWSRVDKRGEDECWPWTGVISPGRERGILKIKGKSHSSSRASYIIHNGEIPDGLCVCHTCDNGLCCNPKHLFLGTTLDNMRDKVAKNRQAKGSRGGRAKLNEEQVLAIRERYANKETTITQLSKEYGVSWSAIRFVVTGRNWKHL